MRILPACLCAIVLGASSSIAATAIDALEQLTPDQLTHLAAIVARDGTPEPDRWQILVQDPTSETGLCEIVVSGGRKTAERRFSQFAQKLTAADVLEPVSLRVDSDRIAKLALQFGALNRIPVSALHYDLRKSGADGSPLWTVTCMDAAGNELGKILVSATSGAVLLHPGFPTAPAMDLGAERPRPASAAEEPEPGGDVPFQRTRTVRKATAVSNTNASPTPAPRAGFLQRMFGGGNSRR
jgi:hypothetical protein